MFLNEAVDELFVAVDLYMKRSIIDSIQNYDRWATAT
jgi:hypothetical protein